MAQGSLLSTLANRCPRCARGRVFDGLLRQRDACDSCGFSYHLESGQHLGAAVLSYAIGAAVALPVFFFLLFQRAPIAVCLGVPVLVLAILAPFSVRFSRLAWMYFLLQLHPRPAVRRPPPRS